MKQKYGIRTSNLVKVLRLKWVKDFDKLLQKEFHEVIIKLKSHNIELKNNKDLIYDYMFSVLYKQIDSDIKNRSDFFSGMDSSGDYIKFNDKKRYKANRETTKKNFSIYLVTPFILIKSILSSDLNSEIFKQSYPKLYQEIQQLNNEISFWYEKDMNNIKTEITQKVLEIKKNSEPELKNMSIGNYIKLIYNSIIHNERDWNQKKMLNIAYKINSSLI